MAEAEYEIFEWESESEGESEAEAARKPAPKRPSSQPSFKPRPPAGTPAGVTQAQLEAALARVDSKIKTVADGVSTISSRVNSVTASAKKEADQRKKTVDNQGKDLNQKLQLLALLPLLIQSPTATLQTPLVDTNNNKITTISTPDTSSLDAILPLLLVSGLGGSSGPGGLSFGGDSSGSDGSMLLLALVLAFSSNKRN
jgi:hypothetical protein